MRTLTSVLLITLFCISACQDISHGLQRRKFEYLYKLNNFGTIFREYTGDVVYYRDLELYRTRLGKLYADVNGFETVPGYEKSFALKESFLDAIETNTTAVTNMLMKQGVYGANIRNEIEVIRMREISSEFLKEVDDEIVKVGKE
ncbi:MAG: hypothetical protein K1X85_10890 [Ignavibacteria bacterium]|nr:hypothetical protein [Ignavibacteria bacterium]